MSVLVGNVDGLCISFACMVASFVMLVETCWERCSFQWRELKFNHKDFEWLCFPAKNSFTNLE